MKLRQQVAAMGRGQMLLVGLCIRGQWWTKSRWAKLEERLPADQLALLEPLRQTVMALNEQLHAAEQSLKEAHGKAPRPKGAGAQTLEQIDREIWDWTRFNNRKQIGSYTGLCGGVSASGQFHADLPITKAGNGRLRRLLVEMSQQFSV